jgi:ribosome-binding protein aMBF1 (putative translation factor)
MAYTSGMRERFALVTKTVEVIDDDATGAACRGAREAAGLSVRALAKRLGWSAPYQSDLERGKRPWSAERVEKVNAAIQQEEAS